MTSQTKIVLGDLDFDAIKTNLKNYLRGQAEFQDYDFEGSGMNILLDTLAYNTHYKAFYLNMVANEMFMDSAVLRPSVVSHAKHLGYTPRSVTASLAVATLALTKTGGDPTTVLTIPKYTPFISETLEGTSYRFYNTSQKTVQAAGDVFTFTDLELKEGQYASYSYVFSSQTNSTQTFNLPDANIDTSTLEVVVQKSISNSDKSTYTLATDATEVLSTTKVYYLDETTNGKYQIYFGDDIIGAGLEDGNVVSISYLITNHDKANGLSKFTLQTPLLSGATSVVTTTVKSAGGSPQELVEDIKFSAPKAYAAQNRAVTKNDYIALINRKYPYFEAINVWGGEELTPPIYGKIFISAKPKYGFEITQSEKDYVVDSIIKPVSVVTVTPEFVDPDYNYLNFELNVFFDPSKTNKTPAQLETVIRNAVSVYNETAVNTFNSKFKVSRMLRSIDDSDISIESSTVDIFLQKKFSPTLGTSKSYVLEYGTELHRGVGADRLFTTPYYSLTDTSGIERECYIEETPLSFSGIEEIQVLYAGQNYTSTPTITITGDGAGASAHPIIVNGKIQSVIVDDKGTGYTTATAVVTGGGGTGAELVPLAQARTGTLRSYYYDSNKNKIINNTDIGSIDYVTGTIKLNNLLPTNIGNDNKVLSVLTKPLTYNFSSKGNIILAYDSNDISSLTINLTPIG